jgi:pimeloyl-ACP methyl ester carboxylesterase
MTGVTYRNIKTNGITMRVAEAGAGPLVLMVHGWPESWYSWRHQLPALAEAGFHAVAVDVRGYGGSDAPEGIEAYSMRELAADMAGAVEALGASTAVVAGHDWGAPIAYHAALLYPDVFRGVIGMSVPYTGRPPAPPLKTFAQLFKDSFFYIDYFQDVGVAERELEADVRRSLKLILFAASGDGQFAPGFAGKPKGQGLLDGMVDPAALPRWLSEADLDYYASEFARAGFRGGINRYRNMDRDWEELASLAGAQITQPALFLAGEKDGVIAFNPSAIETMKLYCPELRNVVLLPGAGHWTQQERPEEVNAEMIAFLKGLD